MYRTSGVPVLSDFYDALINISALLPPPPSLSSELASGVGRSRSSHRAKMAHAGGKNDAAAAGVTAR